MEKLQHRTKLKSSSHQSARWGAKIYFYSIHFGDMTDIINMNSRLPFPVFEVCSCSCYLL